jgi:branched-chain amino acid aminotransferase
MGFFASVNGLVTPADEARISVLDNGFTFGDGVYETLRTYGGRPFALDRHLRRLRRSCASLGIGLPLGDDELAARLSALLERAGNQESYMRLMVSRGVGEVSYRFDRVQGPTVVMLAKPYEPLPPECYENGVPIALVSVRRNSPQALDPAIKSCNLLNNILAMREAQSRGALEGLMLNERGDVAEAAGSNIFVVQAGQLLTPPLQAGILAGITREVVLELCAGLGQPVAEQLLRVTDLLRADEVFITSTLKEVVPVATVDDRLVGQGWPGPVTRRLLQAYRDFARAACS